MSSYNDEDLEFQNERNSLKQKLKDNVERTDIGGGYYAAKCLNEDAITTHHSYSCGRSTAMYPPSKFDDKRFNNYISICDANDEPICALYLQDNICRRITVDGYKCGPNLVDKQAAPFIRQYMYDNKMLNNQYSSDAFETLGMQAFYPFTDKESGKTLEQLCSKKATPSKTAEIAMRTHEIKAEEIFAKGDIDSVTDWLVQFIKLEEQAEPKFGYMKLTETMNSCNLIPYKGNFDIAPFREAFCETNDRLNDGVQLGIGDKMAMQEYLILRSYQNLNNGSGLQNLKNITLKYEEVQSVIERQKTERSQQVPSISKNKQNQIGD